MEWFKSLFPNLRQASIRWSEDDASSLAASVAYYLALSMFPMMLVLVTGLAIFLNATSLGRYATDEFLNTVAVQSSQTTRAQVSVAMSKYQGDESKGEGEEKKIEEAKKQLLDTLETYGSESIRTQVAEVISHLGNQSLLAGPLSFVAAILAAIGVFAQLDRGFDRIWRITPPKDTSLIRMLVRVVVHRFTALLMLFVLGGMVAALFVVSLTWSVFRKMAGSTIPELSILMGYADSIITVAANAVLFSLVYKWLPKKQVGWIDALRGGLLASLIWELGRVLLGSLLIGMKYSAAYGAVGSFIALLLWCYYGVSIIFFGAEYVQVLQERRRLKATIKASHEARADTGSPESPENTPRVETQVTVKSTDAAAVDAGAVDAGASDSDKPPRERKSAGDAVQKRVKPRRSANPSHANPRMP